MGWFWHGAEYGYSANLTNGCGVASQNRCDRAPAASRRSTAIGQPDDQAVANGEFRTAPQGQCLTRLQAVGQVFGQHAPIVDVDDRRSAFGVKIRDRLPAR
ncbi:MAG TPA: hypothetical protein DIC59_03955 [Candidatus Competibacteraceae bacterium]|nr:hypothetical protein [Candidatus Competibacteraceae bacterium]